MLLMKLGTGNLVLYCLNNKKNLFYVLNFISCALLINIYDIFLYCFNEKKPEDCGNLRNVG